MQSRKIVSIEAAFVISWRSSRLLIQIPVAESIGGLSSTLLFIAPAGKVRGKADSKFAG